MIDTLKIISKLSLRGLILLRSFRLLFFILLVSHSTFSQLILRSSISDSFDAISQDALTISFTNSLEVVNSGGHLQGIQKLLYNDTDYFILSGSSSDHSYYTVVKTGKTNIVTSVNKILDKPLKHAGGFQVWGNLMAVGVEDNDAKNKSRVFVFNIENPERPPEKPLTIIERIGTFKRATAGCVAITIINEKVLIAVGDWDSQHLDFYRISEEKLYEEGAVLELEYSMDSRTMNRENWVDESWNSYQSINFIQDEGKNLYLAGMTSTARGEDIIDVFLIESQQLSEFTITKIYSRKFAPISNTKFRWGAGISVDQDGKVMLMASEEHITANSMISIYK